MTLILQNIKAPISMADKEAIESAKKKLLSEGIDPISLAVSKKSVDARNRNDICYICSVSAEIDENIDTDTAKKLGAVIKDEEKVVFEHGSERLNERPLVVGFGPCGMFASLVLAKEGYRPIVIERGSNTEERVKAVENFYKSSVLDENTNIQFGAGGAGTFSDGKLITRINDPYCSLVLEKLVEFGAPEDILVSAKPHIGTDLLRGITERIASEVERSGGEIHWNTKFEGFTKKDGYYEVDTSNGKIGAGAIILAIGHSARDTYGILEGYGFDLRPKAFSAGVRIEHLREDINIAMYGKFADKLPNAEYQLSKRIGERGVYTFCMCPGGEVVAAASENGGVVVNGMSRRARNSTNSNSAVAVSVLPKDYGNTVGGAIMFQRMLEKRAYSAGGGGFYAPSMTLGDFMSGKSGSNFKRVKPSYMNGKVRITDVSKILPGFINEMLKAGFYDFGKKIKGFDSPYAVITGVETRTSAPIRIERSENYSALGFEGIYPCGEGAGYAGGITSAAVDGIRTAKAIIAKYKEIEK